MFSDFFLLFSRSRHYSHRITSFSDEHHRLPLYNLFFFFFFRRKSQLIRISSLRKPKTKVIGHLEVELVETITPVFSRSPKNPSHAVTLRLKSTHGPMRRHAPPALESIISMQARALHAPASRRAYVSTTSAPNPTR